MKRRPSHLLALLALAWALAAWAEDDNLARCMGATNEPDQKIRHCSELIDNGTLSGERLAVARNVRGLAYVAKRKLEAAIADFDAAIALNAQYAWAFNNRGIAHQEQGKLDLAINDYSTAVSLRPSYAQALANRGNAWLSRGELDRAMADLDLARALNPRQIELVLKSRAAVWLARGDYGHAIADYDAALQENPAYLNALEGRAFAHFARGDFARAADDFTSALHLRADAYDVMGIYLARQRGGGDAGAELRDNARKLTSDAWPAPLVRLLIGETTPDAILATASADATPGQRNQQCEADLYIGEWYLLHHEVDKAGSHLLAARSDCDKSIAEYAISVAELARIK